MVPLGEQEETVRTAVIIMSRVPRPGETKTRLTPPLSVQECADFHRAALRDISAAVRKSGLPGYLYYTDDQPAADETFYLADYPWLLSATDAHFLQLRSQTGNGLGERMQNAALEMLSAFDAIVIVGSDLPALSSQHFAQVISRLDQHDLVLGPADDGGYYLLGMKQVYEPLFAGISWGTSEVLAETLQRAERLHLSWALLEPLTDIDTWQDLLSFVKAGQKNEAKYEQLAAFQYAEDLVQKYAGIGEEP